VTASVFGGDVEVVGAALANSTVPAGGQLGGGPPATVGFRRSDSRRVKRSSLRRPGTRRLAGSEQDHMRVRLRAEGGLQWRSAGGDFGVLSRGVESEPET